MFNLQGLKNLRKILAQVSEELEEARETESPKKKGDLLSNIAGQLHKDHISGSCGKDIADATDEDIAPIREGVSEVMTVTKDGPVTKVHIRMMTPEKEDQILSGAQDQIGNVLDKFSNEDPMVPGMEDKDSYNQAMDMSFDDVTSKMKDKLRELLNGSGASDISSLLDNPCFDGSSEEGCQGEFGEDTSEEVDNMNKIFPENKIHTPPPIEGGFEWNANVGESSLRLAADLCVVKNMVKTAAKDPNAISKRQILAMLDPSRYDDLDEEMEDELINLYSGVLADEVGIKEATASVEKMQKRAYQIIGVPEHLNNDDRRRRDGSMPPNYEEWLRNVGESHHRAFSRIEEIHNPDPDIMKLRIPDGERSNPIRRELAGTETRMRRADLNNTTNDPKDSFERKLEGEGPTLHRGTDDMTHEEKLEKKRGKDKEVTGHPEERLEDRRKDKTTTSTEAQMEDAKLRKYQGFNQVVDSLLNDWRKEHKDMIKQANANGKIIPTSIILGSPNLTGAGVSGLPMGAVDEMMPEEMPGEMPEESVNPKPGFQSIEGMLSGPKTDKLPGLIEKLLGRMDDLEGKLTHNTNPEGIDQPSTAQDAAVGSPDVYMGSGQMPLGPPNDNGWNSFVGDQEKPVAPKP